MPELWRYDAPGPRWRQICVDVLSLWLFGGAEGEEGTPMTTAIIWIGIAVLLFLALLVAWALAGAASKEPPGPDDEEDEE